MLKDVRTGKIKLAAISQGDKDSIFAMYIAATFGWDIACLVNIQTAEENLVHLQAKAMALPLIAEQSSGEQIADMYEAIKKAKEKHQITGVIASHEYETVSKVCKELQVRMFAPFWQKDPMQLLKEMIELGMDMRISSVHTEILGEQWVGRVMDNTAYKELMQLYNTIGFNPAESTSTYKTCVLNCPHLFKKQLKIRKAEKIMESETTGICKMEVALV